MPRVHSGCSAARFATQLSETRESVTQIRRLFQSLQVGVSSRSGAVRAQSAGQSERCSRCDARTRRGSRV